MHCVAVRLPGLRAQSVRQDVVSVADPSTGVPVTATLKNKDESRPC